MGERALGGDIGVRVRDGRGFIGVPDPSSRRAGLSGPTIARIEGGQHVLMSTLEKVARSLDLRLELRYADQILDVDSMRRDSSC